MQLPLTVNLAIHCQRRNDKSSYSLVGRVEGSRLLCEQDKTTKVCQD